MTFLRAAGLTDYEVWDLNDEINKLMREKRHWEIQIISLGCSLGCSNYRRNVAMDEKYQGLRDISAQTHFLPSSFRLLIWTVLKLLWVERRRKEEEENATHNFYKKF